MRLVDLSGPLSDVETADPGPVIAIGSGYDIAVPHNEPWLDRATVTLTEAVVEDRRVVTVSAAAAAVSEIKARITRWPLAATICDDVLRAFDPCAPTLGGIITESLAYSTLQAGPEFARWLAERGPASSPELPDPVVAERDGDVLRVRFNRPARHNAFSNDARAALLEALDVARYDNSVREVVLSGNGESFCSGGELAEFGSFADPVAAHVARTRHSPALVLDELTARLGRACRAEVHGHVLGSGLEMAAFCGWVVAQPDATLGLPELALGLIPGAGGTVSITRRIGRWRTAYLVLSGCTIDPATALSWGLVDEVCGR